MFGFSKNKSKELKATQTGELIEITTLPDPVFAEKMLGDGFAIKPSDGKVYSPASGTVIDIQDSLHAYGIETPDGLQLLVHIGINTVDLNGEGFTSHVKKGDKINAGELLATADLDFIKSKGYPTETITLITNLENVKSIKPISPQSVIGGTTVALVYEK